MDTRPPHDIVTTKEVKIESNPDHPDYRRWMPLTEKEAIMLKDYSFEDRQRWLLSLPFTERLKRFSKAEEELIL